ncbi:MAG: outer membrane protein assembly factor BamB [Gammaproteobacteria bacterium]|nr:outer membrane protein assembly factor BamB [Gammaproteobacteria bacterium]
MKPANKLCVLALLFFIAACSGDKDNSEPPAPLTVIEAPVALKLNWQLDTRAAENTAAYRLRPLIIDNRAYTIDTSGMVFCVDIATGKRLWKYATDLSALSGLGGNENIVIATSKDGEIAAFQIVEKGLEPLWEKRVSSEIRATPVVNDDQVFVRSVDGKLQSLALADGSQQWVVSRRVPVLSLTGNSEPLIDAQLVYAGFDDGKLVAFDRRSGTIRWETTISVPSGRTEVERLVDLDGQFLMRDGVIYVASFQGRLAAVVAVNGDLLWSRDFSSFQSMAIDDNAIYLSADNSDLWSIDRRTGSAFWKQDVLHARKITAPAIINDKLVVADLRGYLHWFDTADGKLVGRIQATKTRNYVQPLIWRDAALTLDQDGLFSSVSVQQ